MGLGVFGLGFRVVLGFGSRMIRAHGWDNSATAATSMTRTATAAVLTARKT